MQYAEGLSEGIDTERSLRRKKDFFGGKNLLLTARRHCPSPRAVSGSGNCLRMVIDLRSPWDAQKTD